MSENKKQPVEILLLALQTKDSLTVSHLMRKLSLTTKELFKLCLVIESWGYKIKRTKNNISLTSRPDALIDSEISFKLQTKYIGKNIHSFKSLKSTNIKATELAEQNAPAGTIVTSEQQTKGKGRLGRNWYSPEKSGIYLSIILRPSFSPESAPGISIMTAVALADSIKELCDGTVQIKWPNDILINKKKTAGILTELSADKNKINYLVVGVGINVNQKLEDFPDDIKQRATSLRLINRKKVNRVELLKLFLHNFEKRYTRYQKKQLTGMLKEIRNYSSLIGSDIALAQGNNVIKGRAVDIDKNGALMIDVQGHICTINSGEVTVVKKSLKQ